MSENELLLKREEIAQQMYEKYDFGENVSVEGHDSWDTDCDTLLRVVYIDFLDEAKDEDCGSEKVSFHVDFKPGTTEIQDVHGLLMSSGGEIGFLPEEKEKQVKLKIK